MSCRFQAASTAVQDLLLLNVSPLRAQPPSRSIGTEYAVVTAIAPEQLYFPLGDAGIPQRISRFTVLRCALLVATALNGSTAHGAVHRRLHGLLAQCQPASVLFFMARQQDS